jgi:hypothetical protein
MALEHRMIEPFEEKLIRRMGDGPVISYGYRAIDGALGLWPSVPLSERLFWRFGRQGHPPTLTDI